MIPKNINEVMTSIDIPVANRLERPGKYCFVINETIAINTRRMKIIFYNGTVITFTSIFKLIKEVFYPLFQHIRGTIPWSKDII
jgi:hypothetical protein